MWKLKVLILSIISLSVAANLINKNLKLEFGDADELLSYRLPNKTVPKSYDITIETNIHENTFNFSGNVKILVNIVEVTDSITLHARQLEIDNIDVLLPNRSQIIMNAAYELVESHDFLIINLQKFYNVNEELLLDISYRGNLRDDNAGFYRSSYLIDEESKWFAVTQFQMDNARHAMPCFDEPGFRAMMKLTLKHGSEYSAISNTDVESVTPDGSYVITTFEETPPMPTYLLAFIVSDFQNITVNTSGIPQKFYGRPEKIQQDDLLFAAGVAEKILDIYETFLLTDYPLNKLDHVAVQYPRKYSMENFGLITYDEHAIIVDSSMPEVVKEYQRLAIINRISNAVSMQWFGNTVSPRWWQHLWLSEGFGKFFEGYLQYLYFDDKNLMDKHFTSITRDAFSFDSLTDRTMNQYVEHPNDLWGKLNAITISKSACILRMIMEVMTEDVFINGLNYYLTENFMQSVTPTELHRSLQKAYDQANIGNPLNIGIIMETWEDQPGFPLISVNVSGSNLIISQNKYSTNNGETYSVPLTFATKSNPNFTPRIKTWLPLRVMPFSQASLGFAAGDWIILNIHQVGYYRVDYDRTLWHAIIDQLKHNHTVINPINREVLQDEFLMAWMELNRVNGGDALSLLSYLGNESYSAVWERANEALLYMKTNLFGTVAYDEFLKFLQQITKPHLIRLEYDSSSSDSADDQTLRSITKHWNCIAIDGDCVARDFTQLFVLFRHGHGDGNFDFCNALKITDHTTYQEILNAVIDNPNLNHRSSYIYNLGCSILTVNLQTLLEAVLNGENGLSPDEKGIFVQTMATTSNLGLEMSLNFFDEHYLDVIEV
ncbi:hypothetical protein ACKWTF_008989 [Chironomus riparius]